MPSNHLILWSSPSPSAFNLYQHQGLFQWVISLHQGPKNWSFSISPSNECPGLISFRVDWFGLLAVQGALKSLLQHHNLKASILWLSAFFVVQFSHPHMTIGKTIALTIQTFVDKVISLLFNTLSRFVIAFLPRSKHLLILGLQSLSEVILELKNKNLSLLPFFPFLFVTSNGTGCHEHGFFNVEFNWRTIALLSWIGLDWILPYINMNQP